VAQAEIAREIRLRDRFVRGHFGYSPSQPELKDLTEFMHGGAAELADCVWCGLTVRREAGGETYEHDVYDPALLTLLYPRYCEAFRDKERQYRHLLPHQAEVLELGSHAGAFLEVAEEWGWKPRGLDIGEHTARFARRRGLAVQRADLRTARVPEHKTDGLFVWNCFEQIEDPAQVLSDSQRVLKRHGLLVVRTPNIAFYHGERLRRRNRAAAAESLWSLAHNNLLGFPYLTGYHPGTLCGLLRRHGFEPFAGFDSTVLTMPYPQITPRLQREIRRSHKPFSPCAAKPPRDLCGPWIEIACRKVDR
jgi:SAM-dependent methyltransferase